MVQAPLHAHNVHVAVFQLIDILKITKKEELYNKGSLRKVHCASVVRSHKKIVNVKDAHLGRISFAENYSKLFVIEAKRQRRNIDIRVPVQYTTRADFVLRPAAEETIFCRESNTMTTVGKNPQGSHPGVNL